MFLSKEVFLRSSTNCCIVLFLALREINMLSQKKNLLDIFIFQKTVEYISQKLKETQASIYTVVPSP